MGVPDIAGLLLAPGAGTSSSQPGLVRIEDDLRDVLPVRRFDFPYRLAGRRAPDRAPVLVAAVRAAAEAFASDLGVDPSTLALGGRSMGGRMCSMAASEGLPCAALVLICYPLHPPGRPDRLRTDHFPELAMPVLFVSGTRDEFGTPEELTTASALIPGPVTHVWCEGARHDLKGRDAVVSAAVREFLTG